MDTASQMAVLDDDSLIHGAANIQMLSDLLGEMLTSSEVNAAALQSILDDSIFDFVVEGGTFHAAQSN